MSDENVGGFEEWFAAQWGIGGHRQIALSAWNAALSAHGQPVVDEDVAEEGGFFHLDDLARAIEKLGWRTSDFEALTAALTGATP